MSPWEAYPKLTSPYSSTLNPAPPPCTFCLKYTNQVIPAAPLSRPMTPLLNVSQRTSMPTSNLCQISPIPYPGYQPFSQQDPIPTYSSPT